MDVPLTTIGSQIKEELVSLIETEGIELDGMDGTPDDLWEGISNTLDSEAFGRVAALVTLAENISRAFDGAVGATRFEEETRRACLPGKLRHKDRNPYTVIGIYEENRQPWADVIYARNADHAAAIAQIEDESGGELIVTGVVEGEQEVLA